MGKVLRPFRLICLSHTMPKYLNQSVQEKPYTVKVVQRGQVIRVRDDTSPLTLGDDSERLPFSVYSQLV